MQVEAELDVHLVWGLGEGVQLGDDAFDCGLDAANCFFEGLPCSFSDFRAFEAACHRTCFVLCDLDEH